MVEREKEMWMVKVWSHGYEVSEYEVEDRQCLSKSRILSCRYFCLSCTGLPVLVVLREEGERLLSITSHLHNQLCLVYLRRKSCHQRLPS